jgi:type IV secretory pathway TrbF-like protein
MSTTHWLPSPAKDFTAAKRQYVEQFGSTLVMNTYLKIALLAVSLIALSSIGLNIYQVTREPIRWIIPINEVGRAQALSYDDFEYQPREAEIKYFLMEFIQHHYSRMRATVRENYARSLYFLEGRLADAVMEANKKTNEIETFLASSSEEIEVQVKNVSIEDLREPPYRAMIDFEKVYYTDGTRQETRRERYVGNVVFVVKDKVPNAMIPVNPLGFTITYFREDQAFK